MSTKSTIKYGEDFHFYNEVFDDDNVYLELSDCYFESNPNCVTVTIPKAIWARIRETAEVNLDYANLTDDQIKKMVTKEVGKRINDYNKKGGNPFLYHSGMFIYGSVDELPSDQIKCGTEHFKEMRAKEKIILKRITKYEKENS